MRNVVWRYSENLPATADIPTIADLLFWRWANDRIRYGDEWHCVKTCISYHVREFSELYGKMATVGALMSLNQQLELMQN